MNKGFCDEHQVFRMLGCPVCLDKYIEEQVNQRTEIIGDTLTRVQEECTRLLLENRSLKSVPPVNIESTPWSFESQDLELSPEPVIPTLEVFEVIYAKDQPEYRPLRALKSMKDDGAILCRFGLTDTQRQAIMRGEDLYLEILTWFQPLQPVRLSVGTPDFDTIVDNYGLRGFEGFGQAKSDADSQ